MLKKILIGIGIIISIIVCLFGYFIYQDFKQEDILKREILLLSNKDFLNDNYSVTIKTSGDYAYVENAIKKFYKRLSDDIKSVNYYINDDELLDILSIDNIKKDGPKFNNSYQVLNRSRDKIGKALDDIILLCNEDNVKNLLDKDKVSDYYIDFYRKLMCTEDDLKEFREVRENMEELVKDLNSFFDKIKEILDMLVQNEDSWVIEDGQLYFDKSDLVDKYNRLYGELKDIATSFESDYSFKHDDVSV